MSNLATPDSFAFQRRYSETDVPGVGTIRHRNLNGRESSKVKAIVQQTAAAKSEQAAADAFTAELVEWWVQCVVNEAGEPVYTDRDRDAIAGYDSGVLEFVAEACARFCRLPDLPTTVKN